MARDVKMANCFSTSHQTLDNLRTRLDTLQELNNAPKMAANPPPPLSEPPVGLDSANNSAPLQTSVAPPSTSMLRRMGGPSDLKAGLGKRDPEEVQKIIYENSKGKSTFSDLNNDFTDT